MEHELFRSKLKPSVDAALLSEMIRSSSSGEHPHRAAVMEAIFERSIRECHGEVLTNAMNASRPDPASQPEGNEGAPNITIPQAQSHTPAPASGPPSHSPPNSAGIGLSAGFMPASVESEVSLTSPTFTRLAKKRKGIRYEDPADAGLNSPLPEDTVELVCRSCGTEGSRGTSCITPWCFGAPMCTGCGNVETEATEACTGCHKRFKW